MNWLTIIWSTVFGACLMLALMHLLIWCGNRRSWAHLCLSLTTLCVMGGMVGEWMTMHSETPETFGNTVRWLHLIYGMAVFGSLAFIHFYFGTSRRWLLILAVLGRLTAVIMNFASGVNLHLSAIHSLTKIRFLGEEVSILGEWVINPWAGLGPLAAVLQAVYVVDASIRLWRSGGSDSRNRALVLGGSFAFFSVFGSLQAGLVANGTLRMPAAASMPFLCVVLAMGYKLSSDGMRAIQLSHDLHESEERMKLATDAANLGIWTQDLTVNKIWATAKWRALFGIDSSQPLEVDTVLQRIHPEDREVARQNRANTIKNGGSYETEYRVIHPDGQTHWIASHGQVERNAKGKPILVRGVSVDITAQKQADAENQRLHTELTHLSRISALGELAGTLAHELNQPLAAMLSNSQVGQRSLLAREPDLIEMGAIFEDITADAKRAGGIIHSMRALVKKEMIVESKPMDMNSAISQVLNLMSSEILARKSRVEFSPTESLPAVMAVRAEIQQILINLVINCLDAMKVESGSSEGAATIEISTEAAERDVRVTVRDRGPGIAADVMDRLFQPFTSTKPDGLGLGLAISRRIMERFGGRLEAENHPQGGAVFRMVLPAVEM